MNNDTRIAGELNDAELTLNDSRIQFAQHQSQLDLLNAKYSKFEIELNDTMARYNGKSYILPHILYIFIIYLFTFL